MRNPLILFVLVLCGLAVAAIPADACDYAVERVIQRQSTCNYNQPIVEKVIERIEVRPVLKVRIEKVRVVEEVRVEEIEKVRVEKVVKRVRRH